MADHLKKARLDRVIPQRDAARASGCGPLTFLHLEKGCVAPLVRFWPAILRFLRYDPRARSPRPLVGRSGPHVKPRAIPSGVLALRLDLDPGTLATWERGEMSPGHSRTRWVVERLLTSLER